MEAKLAASAECVLLLAVLVAPWPYGSALDAARYSLASALLLAVSLWLLACARTGRSLPDLFPAAAGLPLVGFAQLIFGRSVARAWTLDAVIVLAAMLSALVFWSERAHDRGAANRLAAAILTACGAQAVFGAIQWSISPTRIYGQAAPIITMPFGSFVNHNHFAGLVEMGALLALGMAVGRAMRHRGASAWSVLFAGVALALVAAHLASRSRGGLVALAGGAVLVFLGMAALSRRRALGLKGALLAGSGAIAVIAFGLAAVSPGARGHLATLGRPDASGHYRLDIAAATLRLAATRPLLGSGLGAYEDAVPRFKRGHGEVRTTHAESDVLEFAAEAGVAGLLAATWLARRILRALREKLSERRDPYRKGLAIGAGAAAAALLLHGLVDFNLRIPSNALVFASLLGLAASSAAPSGRKQGARGAALGGGALFILAAMAAWTAHGAIALDRALREPDLNRRIESLSALLDRHPLLAEAHRSRGVAWRELATGRTPLRSARLVKAERDLVAAVQGRPLWAEAWADLGWVRGMRGNLSQARSDLDYAAWLDPTHPSIRFVRAEFVKRTAVR